MFFIYKGNKIIKTTEYTNYFISSLLIIYSKCDWSILLYFNLILQSLNRESPRYLMEGSKTKKQSKKTTKKTVKKTELSFGMALDLDNEQLMNAPPPASTIQEDDDDFLVSKGKIKTDKPKSQINEVREPIAEQKKQITQSEVVNKQAEPLIKQSFYNKPTITQNLEHKYINQEAPVVKEPVIQQIKPQPMIEQKEQVIAKQTRIQETVKSMQKIKQQAISIKQQKPKQQQENISEDEFENQPVKISKNQNKKKPKKTTNSKKVSKKQPKLSIINKQLDEQQPPQPQIQNIQEQQKPAQGSQRSIQQQIEQPKQVILQLKEKDSQIIQQQSLFEEQTIQIKVQPQIQRADLVPDGYQYNQRLQMRIQYIQQQHNQYFHKQQASYTNQQAYNKQSTAQIIQDEPKQTEDIPQQEPIKIQPVQQQLPEQSKENDQVLKQEQQQPRESEEQQLPIITTKTVPKKKPTNKEKAKKPKPKSTNTGLKLGVNDMDWQEENFKNQPIEKIEPEPTNQTVQKLQNTQEPQVEQIPQPVVKIDKVQQPQSRFMTQQSIPVEIQPINQQQSYPAQIHQQKIQSPKKQQQITTKPAEVPKVKQIQITQEIEDLIQNKISITKNEKSKKTTKTSKTKKPASKTITSKIIVDDLDDMIEVKQQKLQSMRKDENIVEEAVQEVLTEIKQEIVTQFTPQYYTEHEQQTKLQTKIQPEIPKIEELPQQYQPKRVENIESIPKIKEIQVREVINQSNIQEDELKIQVKITNQKKKKTTKAKETKTTKLKINKFQVEDILEEDIVPEVVVQPAPQIKQEIPLKASEQKIVDALPTQSSTVKEPQIQKLPDTKVQDKIQLVNEKKEEQQIKVQPKQKQESSIIHEIKVEQEDLPLSSGIKITKNVNTKKNNKKEKQPVKKLNLNIADDFDVSIQQVAVPQSPEKKPESIHNIQEQKKQIFTKVQEKQVAITEPIKRQENNQQVELPRAQSKQQTRKNQQDQPKQAVHKIQTKILEQQQKFEDFVNKQEVNKPLDIPPQKILQEEVFQQQNPKFTTVIKPAKQKSKPTKGKDKKKVEDKPKKNQKMLVMNDEDFYDEAIKHEASPQPIAQQPVKKQKVSQKQPQIIEPLITTKKEENNQAVPMPKFSQIPQQAKNFPETSQINTKMTKLSEPKQTPVQVPFRKKLVDELVSIVALSNKKHLTAMKERLLMIQQDIRSSLYERQQKQKIKQTHEVHYDHIIAENLQLKGRLGVEQN